MKNLRSCLILIALFPFAANAQPGFLDTSFGQNGIVKDDIGYDDSAESVLVQPDKKIVVGVTTYTAGDTNKVTLIRYLENGALDPSFGVGGKSSCPLAPGHDECAAILLQPDGRILMIGSNLEVFTSDFEFDFFVARFMPNGQLDTTFGGGKGYVLTDHDYRDFAASGILRPDGKIILLGNSDTPDPNVIIAQYLPDGSNDPGFGVQGIRVLNLGSDDVARALTLQPDGKLVLCGFRYHILSKDNVWLTRLLPNGDIDPSFGTGGTSVYDKPYSQRAWDCELAPNGDILVAGYNWNQQEEDFLALRFKPSGLLDTQFGNQGEVLINFQEQELEGAGDVLIQPDGKIILVGNMLDEQYQTEFALARLTQVGALDTTFGYQGKITSKIGPYTDYPLWAALAPDGKIVVAGYSALKDSLFGTPYDLVVLRFLGGGSVEVNAPNVLQTDLEAYPNPNIGKFTVHLLQPASAGMTIGITDQNGWLLLEKQIEAGSQVQTVNAENLPAGLYFVQVVAGGKAVAVEKFVKQ